MIATRVRLGAFAAHVCAILFCALLVAAHGEERAIPNLAGLPKLAPLIKRVSPSIVSVTSLKRQAVPGDDPAEGFPDAPLTLNSSVSGSGVIVDARLGLVVTANHVIQGAEAVAATLADGRRVEAKLLLTSPEDDLALLRIVARGLVGLPLGDPDGLEVGDFVLALGDPLGVGQSATFGIVSALHRSCPGIENADLIVTDALIDNGNSGGALISLRGEIVGINVARIAHANGGGLGFAVPVDAVRKLLARVRLQLG